MEWKCFWVNVREGNKVFELRLAVSESKMAECKMAAITNLCQNEWVEALFVQMLGTNLGRVWVSLRGKTKMVESKMDKFKMAEFKMAAIIKLNENEWVWVR